MGRESALLVVWGVGPWRPLTNIRCSLPPTPFPPQKPSYGAGDVPPGVHGWFTVQFSLGMIGKPALKADETALDRHK